MASTNFPPAFHPLKQEINQAVIKLAQANGVKVVLVGGYIRDALLGLYDERRPPHDFDYAVLGGKAIELGHKAADALGGHFVLLDEALDTCRVVVDNDHSSGGLAPAGAEDSGLAPAGTRTAVQIDFAGCMGGTLDTDLKRRDLTINALAWDPEKPDVIIDTVGGLEDLGAKRIKVISEQSLVDDPLRLLRVFRFAAALNFQIQPETLALVDKHAALLKNVAAERVSYELFRVLDTGIAGDATKQMADAGLLEIIFPELAACRRVPPNAFHHLGLFDHSVQTLIECEDAYPELPAWTSEYFERPLAHYCSRVAATKLASLLHDIGKPSTWTVRPDGKHTFIGHDKLGAEMVEEIAKRLKWARPVERFISSMVRWHLRPGGLFHQGPPTERAVYRFYRDVGPDLPELILLSQADFRATRGPGLLEGREILEKQISELLNGYVVFIEGRKRTPRLLDGRDVMQLLEIGPGPVIGEILELLEEARSLGEVMNKQQAQEFVLELYEQKYSK
ncbi:MAG TPA: HDIG domain-containing metalloprotein [Candidatus Obscuribacterales bacterium]